VSRVIVALIMNVNTKTCNLELNSCFFLILDAGYLDIDGIRNLDEALQCNKGLLTQAKLLIPMAIDNYFPATLGTAEVKSWLINRRISLTKMSFSPISGWSGGILVDNDFTKLVALSHNLVNCNLDSNVHITDASIGLMLNTCSNLQALSIKYVVRLNGSGFLLSTTMLPHLKKLDLRGCLHLHDDGIAAFTKRIPNLKEIAFADNQRVTDITVIELACNCCQLEGIHFDRMIHITEDSISLLIEKCQNLRQITLKALYNVRENFTTIKVLSSCFLLQKFIIRTLDMVYGIEDSTVKELVKCCPMINTLHLYSDHKDSESKITANSILEISKLVNLVSLRIHVTSNANVTDSMKHLVKECTKLECAEVRRKGDVFLGDWYYCMMSL
jgi:hypothetical protein